MIAVLPVLVLSLRNCMLNDDKKLAHSAAKAPLTTYPKSSNNPSKIGDADISRGKTVYLAATSSKSPSSSELVASTGTTLL